MGEKREAAAKEDKARFERIEEKARWGETERRESKREGRKKEVVWGEGCV